MSAPTVTIEVYADVDPRRRRAFVRETADGLAQLHAFHRIAFAMLFADTTARPGFREVIDNLHWDEMR
ncbi:hypothetical protein ACQR1Y_11980 [Bradyrhizobium sp. HKCCYLRH3099]|uniref:hypothetical protein n=1 Tax=unclassified Bradyrhizobium TaxID=2631580 RepID=UPI003EBCE66C